MKVGWKVVEVDGIRCSGRPIILLCAVPWDADVDQMINRKRLEVIHYMKNHCDCYDRNLYGIEGVLLIENCLAEKEKCVVVFSWQ